MYVYVEDVDNEAFYKAIVEYKKKVKEAEEKGLDKPRIPEYIGDCIYRIGLKLSYHRWFINYTYKDDMIGDGLECCIKYFDNFDAEKYDNPFAYFTQIMKFAFRNKIMSEEKSRYAMYKFSEQTLIDETEEFSQMGLYENISEFIETYEEKERKRKERRRENAAKKKSSSSGSDQGIDSRDEQ